MLLLIVFRYILCSFAVVVFCDSLDVGQLVILIDWLIVLLCISATNFLD